MEEIVRGYNPKTDSWHCLYCGDDMGPTNPRQYCCKTYCRLQLFEVKTNIRETKIISTAEEENNEFDKMLEEYSKPENVRNKQYDISEANEDDESQYDDKVMKLKENVNFELHGSKRKKRKFEEDIGQDRDFHD